MCSPKYKNGLKHNIKPILIKKKFGGTTTRSEYRVMRTL